MHIIVPQAVEGKLHFFQRTVFLVETGLACVGSGVLKVSYLAGSALLLSAKFRPAF